MGEGLAASAVLQPYCLGVVLLLTCTLHAHLCISATTLFLGQSLTGSQTISSDNGVFELGYFSLGNPSRYYVGIWYKEVSDDKVVWVANRDRPLQDCTAEFKISEDGNLLLQTPSKSLVWSTNLTSTLSPSSRSVILLDSGNLVLRHGNSSQSIVWDSFGQPTNTLLPGGRLELNKVTKQNIVLTSWKNKEDPSHGPFSQEIDPNGTAQILLVWKGTRPYWSTGVWTGKIFSGVPEMGANTINNFSFIVDETVSYFTYSVLQAGILTKLVVDVSGQIKQSIWLNETQQWKVFWARPTDNCKGYALCGACGVCNQDNSTLCECAEGFEPKSAEEWGSGDWSMGCVRKNKLQCGGDQFSLLSKISLPENSSTVTVESVEGCRSACHKDCSCTAYSYWDSKCSTWRGDLLNLQQRSDGSGDTIYIRFTSPEKGARNHYTRVIVAAIVIAAILCAAVGGRALRRWKAKRASSPRKARHYAGIQCQKETKKSGSLEMTVQLIMAATKNFSESNKLGQGGSGSVYKGVLQGGQEVAVKRLSKRSKQGAEEFMNEVRLIAKLHHINLVQLIGCCVEGEERILVYEYMLNRSLDVFLFDPTLSKQLGWDKRYEIVTGIARGLQYLHQESRLKVIHGDLKTSNILLDAMMNPRISDFGLARIFGRDQTHNRTNKVTGTCGYMAPEYAMEGHYSTKSDIFSFGVIILEIVSGLKMTNFYKNDKVDCSLNLLGHAWKLWNEERWVELLDPSLRKWQLDQVMRCFNIGLLCVQDVEDRPTMASIVLMLSSDLETPPAPKQPPYSYMGRLGADASSSTDNESKMYLPKDLTVSMLKPR